MLFHFLLQHFGIACRVQRQERGREAGAESRLRLRHAGFRARHLGRVTRQEVIHRLRRREFRQGRQHAEGVASQEEDVLRMPAAAARLAIRDKFDRIGGPRVFSDAAVVEVGVPRQRIDDHILQHAAEANGIPDWRLADARQADGLGVTAAFDVENAGVGPAVLVVADEPALGVGGKRGLAGARQPEEQRHVAGRADVGGTVHRQHAALR